MRTAKTDQTGRMPRLIQVFTGCTDHFCWFCHALAQMTCVASKDTDLPGHASKSDHSLRCPPVESFCHWLPIKHTSKTDQPVHDKTNKKTCVPSEDSDQPGHPPSLISLRYALNG